MTEEKVSSLLDLLYAGAGDEKGWEAFLIRLGELAGASAGGLILRDQGNGVYSFSANFGLSSEALSQYGTHYSRMDAWFLGSIGRTHAGWVDDGRALCPTAELVGTEFYNDHLRQYDLLHQCGAILEQKGVPLSVLSLLRSARQTEFSDRELELLRAVVPHLQRALQLHRRILDIRQKSEIQTWAVDQVAFGVVLIGSDGKILFANRAARELCDGDGLVLRNDGLHAAVGCEDRRLQLLIRESTDLRIAEPSPPTMQVSRANHRPLAVVVTAFRNWQLLPMKPAVAVLISDPDRSPRTTTALLRELFGLTRSEARLAQLLGDGYTLNAAAELLGVTAATVRSQLKQVFQKVGVSRQSELVRLLLSLPPHAQLNQVSEGKRPKDRRA